MSFQRNRLFCSVVVGFCLFSLSLALLRLPAWNGFLLLAGANHPVRRVQHERNASNFACCLFRLSVTAHFRFFIFFCICLTPDAFPSREKRDAGTQNCFFFPRFQRSSFASSHHAAVCRFLFGPLCGSLDFVLPGLRNWLSSRGMAATDGKATSKAPWLPNVLLLPSVSYKGESGLRLFIVRATYMTSQRQNAACGTASGTALFHRSPS